MPISQHAPTRRDGERTYFFIIVKTDDANVERTRMYDFAWEIQISTFNFRRVSRLLAYRR